MPTFQLSYGFCDSDPRRWERCLRQATREMVAAGWKTYARKFDEVMKRKAMKLWRAAA